MSVSGATEGIDQIQFDYVRVLVLEDTPTRRTTLMDTGFDEDDEELVEILERRYGGVGRIIVTHGGRSHHGGLPSVMEAFDPELVTSTNESKLHETIDYEPDVTFTDGGLLDGNIRVIEVPGHTKATSALLLKDRGILVSGNALDEANRAGLPAGYLLPPPALFNDDHKATEVNLYDLLRYDFEALPIFHGSHVFGGPKGKLDDFLVEREWDPRPERPHPIKPSGIGGVTIPDSPLRGMLF